jgi:hypothetical protein
MTMIGHDIGANFASRFAPRRSLPICPPSGAPLPSERIPWNRPSGPPSRLAVPAQRFLPHPPRFIRHKGFPESPKTTPISTRYTSLLKTPATRLFSVTSKSMPDTKTHVSISLFSETVPKKLKSTQTIFL